MASQVLDRQTPKSAAPYRLLDAWRGIAAFWVVMVHACLPTIANESPALAQTPLYIFSLWGGLGVQMFFVISGYCITAAAVNTLRKPNPIANFVRARLRRIYPPYFFSTIGAVLLSFFYLFLAAHHVIPKPNHSIPFLHQSFRYYFSALTLTQKPLHIDPIINIYWSLCLRDLVLFNRGDPAGDGRAEIPQRVFDGPERRDACVAALADRRAEDMLVSV